MQSTPTLGRLIDACADDEHVFAIESRFVRRSFRARLLGRLSNERSGFVEQLGALDNRPPASPAAPHGESWRERLRDVARTLRSAFGGRNDGDAIAACRRSRFRTERLYERALAQPWSDPAVLPVLRAQYAHIAEEREELLALQF